MHSIFRTAFNHTVPVWIVLKWIFIVRTRENVKTWTWMWNAESCQEIICGKSSAERSANYSVSHFHIPQPKNSAFSRITKLPCTRIVQQMCNRCIAASGVLWSVPSVFFVVWSILQFWLTSNISSVTSFHCSMWLASICIISATVAWMIARIELV